MIFYFSATGNTRWAAQRLAEALQEPLYDMATFPVDQAEVVLRKNEALGFCFPVHGWRPSILVRNFISKLNIKTVGEPYVWALCTAGDNIGETMRLFSADLQQHGLTLAASCSLIMPESYVGLPMMDVDTREKEMLKKHTAAQQLEMFIPHLQARHQELHWLVNGRWPRINSRLIGHVFLHQLVTDKPFRVDKEACIACEQCVKVCPVDNILADEQGHPQWQHNGRCLTCFACYHYCPKHAISFGRRTRGKGQYFFERNKFETIEENTNLQ